MFVAGHSLGGSVALALAARRPELVKGLVLISSCAKTPQNSGTFKALLGALPVPFGRMLFSSTAKSFLFALGADNSAPSNWRSGTCAIAAPRLSGRTWRRLKR
jgi:pimeloyl-ACP methyl ester carboxylesterase